MSRIRAGKEEKVHLGNLNACRDWGYAPEYVEAMWLMLNREGPDDFVIATGETHSVREFAEVAFEVGGFRIRWEGESEAERGIDARTGRTLIEVDPRYFRPAEVEQLQGDASKAARVLGWKPRVKFAELARLMVEADIKALSDGR